MNTDYLYRATIAVPEAYLDDGNALALVFGERIEDLNTFEEPQWQDAQGNRYAVCSTAATQGFADMANGEVKRPNHARGAHMAAAKRAQAMLTVNAGPAAPDRIAVVLGDRLDSAQDHLAALGLTRVPVDEGGGLRVR